MQVLQRPTDVDQRLLMITRKLHGISGHQLLPSQAEMSEQKHKCH